jgi:hypothetical protein
MHYFIVHQTLEGGNDSRLGYGVSLLDHAGPFRHGRQHPREGGGVDIGFGALDLAEPGFSSAWAARFAGCRGFAA